jgi:peptidyl-prolyl cis-trans isomerase D
VFSPKFWSFNKMIRFLQTPGPTKKIVLGGLLLIICAAMVITLVPGGLGTSLGFGGPGAGVVAKVAGQDVTTQEVQREARQMVRQQFPKGGAQASLLMPFFAQRAAENLINQRLVLAEADRLGLRVTDEDLRDELQHGIYGQTFFPDGNFIGQDQYEERLRQADLTVPQFEQTVKDQILLRKVMALVGGSAMVSDAEIHQEFERRNTKVKFEYAVLNQEDIRKGLHPSEEELKAFYERNKPTYNNSIPEKRKIKYALVDTARLAAQTPVTRPELQAYYDEHRDEYRVPEQVKVSHILIKTPLPGADGKVDQKGVDEAKTKAEDILKQLRAGANFAEVAKKYSQDADSAKNGGSLGWIQRGRFPAAEVEKAAFSLPKGATSEVINAGYGFDIIHVDEKQTAQFKTLDEVKEQIEPLVKQQKGARAAENEANSLLSQARSGGLDKAAAAKGVPVVTTDFFSRTDSLPGVGASPQLMDAVFSEAEKSPPDMAQLPQGYAIFELEGIKPAATPTFAEIRSRVEEEFKNERASTLLSQKTQELADRAKAAHDLKKAAKELGATMKTSEWVLPDGQVPDIGSMSGPASVVFNMKPGEIRGPINSGNHDVVISLLEKQAPPEQEFAQKKDAIRESLLESKRNQMFGLFVANLRQQMEKAGKVKVNRQEMKNLTKGQNEEGM